jgi:hypothetical protein
MLEVAHSQANRCHTSTQRLVHQSAQVRPIRSPGAVSEPLNIEAMPRLLHFGQNRLGWTNLREFGLVQLFQSIRISLAMLMRESLGVIIHRSRQG